MTARSLCRYEVGEVGDEEEVEVVVVVVVKCKYVEIVCVGVVSEESPDVTSHQSLTQTDSSQTSLTKI